MATCDVCGNDYDKTFRVTQNGRSMTFDSFECAISALAPVCSYCNCRSSVTVWNRAGHSTVVPIAQKTREQPRFATARDFALAKSPTW